MNEYLRLLRYARPYRGRLTVALLAMGLYAAGAVGLARLVQPIFDKVLILQIDVARVGVLLLVAYLLKGLGGWASSLLMTDVGQRVVMDIRNQLFRHLLDQSAAFFARNTSGKLISRITNDVGQVQMAVSETIADLVRESIAVIGFIVLMFWLDWRLALVTMTAAPLIVYPLLRLGQRVRSSTRRSQQELEHLTHLSAEALTGHRIVKAFGAEGREAERFTTASHSLYRTNMKVTSALAALPPLMELIGGVAAVGALWYGSRRIPHDLTTGDFTSFLTAAFMMYTPIKKLSRVNAGLQQTRAAAERIFELLDIHSEVKERPDAIELPRLRESVEFRSVSFAYEDQPDRFILQNVSFKVRAGQVVALVGLSGAGKTTLVNLLPRFFDVKDGAVLVDGIDVRAVKLRSLRDQVSLVTQETVLFDDTIAANIAYGAPRASPQQIEDAARAAHANEFIVRDLAGGYSARIGERGQRISGGQRQRIAIARAILKNAPLLILDEATSALDAESEQLVREAVANLMRNRTTFIIAHRLSTVRQADFIVVLEEGQVAEIGSHEQLLARPGGVYAKLYALQAIERDRESEPNAEFAREARS